MLTSRRILAAVVAACSTLAAAALLYGFMGQLYYNLYVFPTVKVYYKLPLDWRNLVVIVAICAVISTLFVGGYRLMRYAVRGGR